MVCPPPSPQRKKPLKKKKTGKKPKPPRWLFRGCPNRPGPTGALGPRLHTDSAGTRSPDPAESGRRSGRVGPRGAAGSPRPGSGLQAEARGWPPRQCHTGVQARRGCGEAGAQRRTREAEAGMASAEAAPARPQTPAGRSHASAAPAETRGAARARG